MRDESVQTEPLQNSVIVFFFHLHRYVHKHYSIANSITNPFFFFFASKAADAMRQNNEHHSSNKECYLLSVRTITLAYQHRNKKTALFRPRSSHFFFFQTRCTVHPTTGALTGLLREQALRADACGLYMGQRGHWTSSRLPWHNSTLDLFADAMSSSTSHESDVGWPLASSSNPECWTITPRWSGRRSYSSSFSSKYPSPH